MSYTQAELTAALRLALDSLESPKAKTSKTRAHASAPKADREAISSSLDFDGSSYLEVTASGSGWAAPEGCWSAEFKLGEYGIKVYHYGWTGTEDTIHLTTEAISALMRGRQAQDFLLGTDGKVRPGIADKRGARPTEDCAWRVSSIVRVK